MTSLAAIPSLRQPTLTISEDAGNPLLKKGIYSWHFFFWGVGWWQLIVTHVILCSEIFVCGLNVCGHYHRWMYVKSLALLTASQIFCIAAKHLSPDSPLFMHVVWLRSIYAIYGWETAFIGSAKPELQGGGVLNHFSQVIVGICPFSNCRTVLIILAWGCATCFSSCGVCIFVVGGC